MRKCTYLSLPGMQSNGCVKGVRGQNAGGQNAGGQNAGQNCKGGQNAGRFWDREDKMPVFRNT